MTFYNYIIINRLGAIHKNDLDGMSYLKFKHAKHEPEIQAWSPDLHQYATIPKNQPAFTGYLYVYDPGYVYYL